MATLSKWWEATIVNPDRAAMEKSGSGLSRMDVGTKDFRRYQVFAQQLSAASLIMLSKFSSRCCCMSIVIALPCM